MHEKVRREIAAHSLERSQIIVLDALLKLRQVCCDPRLVKLAAMRKPLSGSWEGAENSGGAEQQARDPDADVARTR